MFLKCFEYNQHFVAMMNVINKARLFPPENGHKHHIIPKCWFKLNSLEVDDSEKNLVLLSKEDHAKVHKLAMLCVKDTRMKRNMACASHFLGLSGTKGYKISEETKKKISETEKGRKHTLEHCRKIAQAHKGKSHTKEHIKHAAEARIGLIRSEFGKKFYDHYGIKRHENKKLYNKEYNHYAWYGFCSWEK